MQDVGLQQSVVATEPLYDSDGEPIAYIGGDALVDGAGQLITGDVSVTVTLPEEADFSIHVAGKIIAPGGTDSFSVTITEPGVLKLAVVPLGAATGKIRWQATIDTL